MKRLAVLLSMVVALALASSAWAAPAFVEASVPDGKALIYLYRPGAIFSSLNPTLLAKDGPIGVLPLSSFLSYTSDPGTVKLWFVAATSASLKVEAVAGHVYYVKCAIINVGTNMFSLTFELVPNDKAKTEIAGCQQVPD